MPKLLFIILLFVFSFMMNPEQIYACSKSNEKTEQSCCNKETSEISYNDCCQKQDVENGATNECDGSCSHASCHCPSTSLTMNPLFVDTKQSHIVFFERPMVAYSKSYTSLDHPSIWLPPKLAYLNI